MLGHIAIKKVFFFLFFFIDPTISHNTSSSDSNKD